MNDGARDGEPHDPVSESVESLVASVSSLPMPERKARNRAGVLARIDARLAREGERRSEEERETPAPAPPSIQKALAPSGLVATLPSSNDAIQKAVAAVPRLESKGEAGEAPFPALTVEQYVSLRAALLVSPGEQGEVLRRYGVPSPASYGALYAHWQADIAANPELRAKMREVIATAVGWLWGEAR